MAVRLLAVLERSSPTNIPPLQIIFLTSLSSGLFECGTKIKTQQLLIFLFIFNRAFRALAILRQDQSPIFKRNTPLRRSPADDASARKARVRRGLVIQAS